jgi:hypothetical protein
LQNDVTLIHSENPSEKKRCEFCFKTTLLSKTEVSLPVQMFRIAVAIFSVNTTGWEYNMVPQTMMMMLPECS